MSRRERLDILVDTTALLRIRNIHTNAPEQVLLIRRTPIHISIVSEAPSDVLLPYIWSLRATRALRPCNETCGSPATQPTTVCILIVHEMEELRIFLVLNDLTSPRGIAAVTVVVS